LDPVSVVSRFGGPSALAKLLRKPRSTVQYWTKAGTIPAKWHRPLLELARAQGVQLDPAQLVGVDEESDERPAVPEAKWWGDLSLGEVGSVSCYVLDDGRRVISRTGATDVLTGRKGGGNLESYLRVENIAPYLPADLDDRMIEFRMAEVTNKTVKGFQAETFLDLCTAYVRARDGEAQLTARQTEIAIKAAMVLAACSKVGLIALIDEATGYQYERAQDALSLKLRLYLAEEMREWEKTFPDELWDQFGRLTNWQGGVTKRPKYWGSLVNELVYGYLDPEVFHWLKTNAPKPKHGQNYHQWMSSQFGLKRLIEHLWKLIGMAAACKTMPELRYRMAEAYGREPFQYTLFIEPPYKTMAAKRPRN
jgi:hypothetical protein